MHNRLIPHCNGQSKECLKPNSNIRGKKKKSEANQGMIGDTGPTWPQTGKNIDRAMSGAKHVAETCLGTGAGGDAKKRPRPRPLSGAGWGKGPGPAFFGTREAS